MWNAQCTQAYPVDSHNFILSLILIHILSRAADAACCPQGPLLSCAALSSQGPSLPARFLFIFYNMCFTNVLWNHRCTSHPHQRSFYVFYTFLIYVHVFVAHRGSSNNSIKCQLLSMSGPRLHCGVISVKMLAFLNLISCEYGASGKPQTADAQRSPRKLKSLWQWQEYQFTHGDCARGKVPLTFNYGAVWVQNSKNTCEGKYCKISLEIVKQSERERQR